MKQGILVEYGFDGKRVDINALALYAIFLTVNYSK